MAKSKKQTVLITGARGMLGQELVSVFKKDKDYDVTAWDREEIDITSQKKLDQEILKLKPNIIINAVGYNAVDKCEESKKEFELAKKVNGQAPGYLAKIAKKIGAVLVHYSSDYVFDGRPDIPEPVGCSGSCSGCGLHKDFKPEIGFDEKAKPRPINNYGRSKLMGEKAIMKDTKEYYLIRTSKIFGKPAQSEGAKRSFFDVMLEVGKKNEEVSGVDEETSCFTYAPDLAKKTKEIIEAKKDFGIYHITNSDACTWYEAILELYEQLKLKTRVVPISGEELPRPAKRPFISTLINTKINPLRSYKKALKEYLTKIK